MDKKKMIGIRIAEIRSQKGMTQDQLANKMGISPKYLSSIERGKENPTLDMLINLSESVDVDLGKIFALIQIEDPTKRKDIIEVLLKKANEDEIKLALKILRAIIDK